jgi:hypothetical protein
MEKLRIEIVFQEGLPGWVRCELHMSGSWQFDAYEDDEYYVPWIDRNMKNKRRIKKELCRLVPEGKPVSQKDWIKYHLLEYGSIRKLGLNGSLRLYGIDALSQRVRELVRNEGMNIITEIPKEGKKFAIYKLVK